MGTMTKNPIFVVHEHHARHLHFDLRLEIDNVLKSWAVPKGPSMNPKEKRLAILVEDHPLAYASFEGTIPEDMYGAGSVAIWDAGTYELRGGDLDSGRLTIEFHGQKLKGGFALAKMSGKEKEWLLIKKKDGHADPGFRLKTVLGNR